MKIEEPNGGELVPLVQIRDGSCFRRPCNGEIYIKTDHRGANGTIWVVEIGGGSIDWLSESLLVRTVEATVVVDKG